MRILELYLKAFGPFTEKRLALDDASSGLHVIFGRNEAGKSSALRALQGLLYGIPGQTTDNFVHEYSQMRIGARISDPDAGDLSFLRKKGNKKTLRSFDDSAALADDELNAFLHGVPEDVFPRLFGIDHAELTDGSKSLLQEDGDLGQALFSAGLGSANLRDVLTALKDEADGLFRPRATNPPMNAAIASFNELKRTVRETSLKGRDWKLQDQAHESANRELVALSQELEQQHSAKTRLERIRNALVPLEQRRLLLAELEELGDAPALPADFESRLTAAIEKQRNAEGVASRSRTQQKILRERLAELGLDASIIEQRDTIEQLKHQLSAYQKAAKDLPRLEIERSHLEKNVVHGLKTLRSDLTPEGLDEVRVTVGRRREIQDLANEHTALKTRIETANETLRSEQDRLKTSRAQLEQLPATRDATPLRQPIQLARGAGEIDERANVAQRNVDAATRECESGASTLGLWSGTLDELVRLPVPEPESVERFSEEFDAFTARRERSRGDADSVEASVREYDVRLETLRRGGATPMESELDTERKRRDLGWRLVRRHWIDGEPILDEIEAFSGSEALPDFYERSVATADEVADRLRREANRVAEQAELEALRQQADKARDAAKDELVALEAEERALQESWIALWASPGITAPHPPREMLAWLRRQRQLVESSSSLRSMRDELTALGTRRDRAVNALLAALQSLTSDVPETNGELAPLLLRAEEMFEEIEAVAGKRNRLIETTGEAEIAVKRVSETLRDSGARRERWSEEWSNATAGLGLTEDARPSAALDRLESANELLARWQEAENLGARITGMQRDMDRVTGDVDAFVALHATELAELPHEERVHSLGRRLSEVERQETLRAEITQQIKSAEDSDEEATQALAETEREFELLRNSARCAENSDLEPELNRWKTKNERTGTLAAVDKQLSDVGAGTPLAQLETESQGVDRDSLPGRIKTHSDQIIGLDARRSDLQTARAEAQAELKRMDGSAVAAETALRAQETLASLRRDVERYVQLRLAHAVLQREIERYREANQSPVLERASRLFTRLTVGSFAGLQSDYDEEGDPLLIGVRPNGRRLQVHEMSSGTRDQLYLALRLATVEEWVERSGPMPFIVDDILVNFDDDRARATLEVLAQFGGKNQVLLFTHHGRDRQHASELGIPVVDLEEN